MRCCIVQQLHIKWKVAQIDRLTLAVFRKLIKARLSGPIAYGRCFGGITVRPDAKKTHLRIRTQRQKPELTYWSGSGSCVFMVSRSVLIQLRWAGWHRREPAGPLRRAKQLLCEPAGGGPTLPSRESEEFRSGICPQTN